MTTLTGRTLLMSGGSRGIGLAIALRAARDRANVVMLAKTSEPHPRLPGTVHSAVAQVEEAGGHGLAVVGTCAGTRTCSARSRRPPSSSAGRMSS